MTVRLNAAVHLDAGVHHAGHRFWEIDDPVNRSRQRTQFLKNTAILGGLLVMALD